MTAPILATDARPAQPPDRFAITLNDHNHGMLKLSYLLL